MVDLKVRDEILLISPNDVEFRAKWAGGTRSVKKRLAQYAYAGVNGQVVDDYGSDSVTYPINLIFDGPDQRKTAKSFFDEFREQGKWRVNHPTEGSLGLQGVEATENDDPITESNITRVDTQWIEYIDPVSLLTLRNALIEMGIAVNELQEEVIVSAAETMEVGPAADVEMKNSAFDVLNAVKEAYNKSQFLTQEALDAQNQLQGLIASAAITVAGLISGVQNMILAPGRLIQDLKVRLRTSLDILKGLFSEDKDPISPNRNDAMVKEAAALSVIASVAEGIIASAEGQESGLQSRADLLSVIATFDDLVTEIDVQTDRKKTLSEQDVPPITGVEKEIEKRYVPFEGVSTQRKNVIAKARNALREQFFELPTERRIITRVPSSVIQLAKDYYGTTGVDDEVLDRIEQANGFTSDQILLIPPGTEVRIYE